MSAFTSNYKLRYDTQTKLSVAQCSAWLGSFLGFTITPRTICGSQT